MPYQIKFYIKNPELIIERIPELWEILDEKLDGSIYYKDEVDLGDVAFLIAEAITERLKQLKIDCDYEIIPIVDESIIFGSTTGDDWFESESMGSGENGV